jgi:hypothetical protein
MIAFSKKFRRTESGQRAGRLPNEKEGVKHTLRVCGVFRAGRRY